MTTAFIEQMLQSYALSLALIPPFARVCTGLHAVHEGPVAAAEVKHIKEWSCCCERRRTLTVMRGVKLATFCPTHRLRSIDFKRFDWPGIVTKPHLLAAHSL